MTSLVLNGEIQQIVRKKRKLSEKQQKIMDFILEVQSGKHDKVPCHIEGGLLHRLNLITTLVSLGIDGRTHIDRTLKSLEKRGDIKMVDNMISA